MVNTDDFIKRLETILDYFSLSASSFADKIGVQRSSMSHLLSGRNKPSLDFILKIDEFFEEVDLYWLLNGKGFFPKNLETIEVSNSISDQSNLKEAVSPIDLFSQIDSSIEKEMTNEKIKQKITTSLQNEKTDDIKKLFFSTIMEPSKYILLNNLAFAKKF